MRTEENTSPVKEPAAASKNGASSQNQKFKVSQPEKNKPSGFQNTLRQVGLSALFLVIGMLVILLALYLPNASKLKEAQSELERLVPIETQYLDLQGSYNQVQAQVVVYKLMSNASLLKVALVDNDSTRISQYLTYIEEDLKQMQINAFPELPASLLTQFEKVKTSVSSDRLTAIDELQKFYNDLLLLSDNLK